MDEHIKSAIKDPDIADWPIPLFTTTTQNNRVVANITIMEILQTYFDYGYCCMCGTLKLTLLGNIKN